MAGAGHECAPNFSYPVNYVQTESGIQKIQIKENWASPEWGEKMCVCVCVFVCVCKTGVGASLKTLLFAEGCVGYIEEKKKFFILLYYFILFRFFECIELNFRIARL